MLFTAVKTALLAAPLPYRVCSQGAAPSCTGYACETTWGRTNGKERLTGVRSDAATAAHCSDGFMVLGAAVLRRRARGSQRAGFLLEKHTWKTRREKAQIEPSRQVVACARGPAAKGAPPVRRVRMVRCQIRHESVRGPGGSGGGVRRGLPESAEVRPGSGGLARCDAAKPSSRKLRRYNIPRRHNTSN